MTGLDNQSKKLLKDIFLTKISIHSNWKRYRGFHRVALVTLDLRRLMTSLMHNLEGMLGITEQGSKTLLLESADLMNC